MSQSKPTVEDLWAMNNARVRKYITIVLFQLGLYYYTSTLKRTSSINVSMITNYFISRPCKYCICLLFAAHYIITKRCDQTYDQTNMPRSHTQTIYLIVLTQTIKLFSIKMCKHY